MIEIFVEIFDEKNNSLTFFPNRLEYNEITDKKLN